MSATQMMLELCWDLCSSVTLWERCVVGFHLSNIMKHAHNSGGDLVLQKKAQKVSKYADGAAATSTKSGVRSVVFLMPFWIGKCVCADVLSLLSLVTLGFCLSHSSSLTSLGSSFSRRRAQNSC